MSGISWLVNNPSYIKLGDPLMYVHTVGEKRNGILLNEERKDLYYATERNKEARYQ